MKLAIERPHDKYGSAIFVENDVTIDKTSMTESDNMEILTVNLGETSSDLSVQTTRFYICLWRTRNI